MTRPVTVTLSHDLGKDEARKRVADGFGKLKGAIGGNLMFAFVEEWTGPDQLSFSAKGFGQTIVGRIDVFPQHVRIEATLPSVLAAIAETITGRMEKEGRLLLEKK